MCILTGAMAACALVGGSIVAWNPAPDVTALVNDSPTVVVSKGWKLNKATGEADYLVQVNLTGGSDLFSLIVGSMMA